VHASEALEALSTSVKSLEESLGRLCSLAGVHPLVPTDDGKGQNDLTPRTPFTAFAVLSQAVGRCSEAVQRVTEVLS
jgi:hypothetical protein